MWRARAALGVLVGGLVVHPVGVAAQEGARLAGKVLDGADGAPVEGARVSLASLDGAEVKAAVAITASDGSYRFPGVSPGRYRVEARRMGYAPASLVLRIATDHPPEVMLGLSAAPLPLDPLVITVAGPPRAVVGTRDSAPEDPTLLPSRTPPGFRPEAALRVADADMIPGSPTGDLFRALSRLPSIQLRDDYSTRFRARGGGWSETRVLFDGVPVFDPVHGGGFLSAVGTDAVGLARLWIGAPPPGLAPGTAATLELSSRAWRPNSTSALGADLTGLQARAGWAASRGSVAASARLGSLDPLSRLIDGVSRDGTGGFPFSFGDVATRADVALAPGTDLAASGMWAGDAVSGRETADLHGDDAVWGTVLGQLTLTHEREHVVVRVSAGASRQRTRVRWSAGPIPDTLEPGFVPPSVPSMSSGVRWLQARFSLADPDGRWASGLVVAREATAYRGPTPIDVARSPRRGWFRNASTTVRPTWWVEGGAPLGGGVVAGGGLRVDAGSGGRLWASPRARLQVPLPHGLTWSLSAARQVQFDQAIAGVGFELGPMLEPSVLWLQEGEGVPAVRATAATTELDLTPSEAVRLSLTVYTRRSEGQVVRTLEPGLVGTTPPILAGRLAPGWSEGAVRTHGMELGATWRSGSWSGQASAAYVRSTLSARGARVPSPWAPMGSLDGTVIFRPARRLELGAALHASVGDRVPAFRPNVCDPRCDDPSVLGWLDPSGSTVPGRARLDLAASWLPLAGRQDLTVWLQIVNAVGVGEPLPNASPPAAFPFLPLLGLRYSF